MKTTALFTLSALSTLAAAMAMPAQAEEKKEEKKKEKCRHRYVQIQFILTQMDTPL